MKDILLEAQAQLTRVLQSLSPPQRLGIALNRSDYIRKMTFTYLVRNHPEASDSQLRRMFADRWLGRQLAAKVYGTMKDQA
jgi:hypothetical protein